MTASSRSLVIYSPSGVVARAEPLRRAAKRLAKHGFDVLLDVGALAKRQRFAGDDEQRLAAIHRVADAAPSVAMASRGGYGLSRLLDRIEWPRIVASIERGTRWVGHSDVTSLQLGLLAHGGGVTWAGPMAIDDFGRDDAEGGVDDVTEACFLEAMSGELEAVGFRTESGFDGLDVREVLWGGNLCVVNSLLGTPHFPRIKGGILFLEDVNEHPYRIERNLLQLHQAGVLDRQKALIFGAFTAWKKSPLDRGYSMEAVISNLRSIVKTPILTGLPFGHIPIKVTVSVGSRAHLIVDGGRALVGW